MGKYCTSTRDSWKAGRREREAGQKAVRIYKLKEHQAARYSSPGSAYGSTADILKDVLAQGAYLELAHETYELAENLYQDNIVTDRKITISYGLIVSDEIYQMLVPEESKDSFWNAILKEEVVAEKGLLQTIAEVNDVLNTKELEYESYLQNMGRSLFYTVAASYTTIYLAVIFLIISNTVIGVQFLMQQQKTRKRYQTLILLGADYKRLCSAAGKQIHWYFLLPILIAVFSSIFGIRALFTGISASSMRGQISSLMPGGFAVVKIVVVEDEPFMREEIAEILEKEDYDVFCITDFKRAACDILALSADLVLLDLNLPGISGFEICKLVRQKSTVPILVLTGREQMKDELHALGLGADEYLNKPCHRERLLMRIANLLRRSADRSHFAKAAGIRLDLCTYTMYFQEGSIVLPENQGKIMELLLCNFGEIISSELLFKKLWGSREYVDENALQVNMTRLRKTLGQLEAGIFIVTERGKGYRLRMVDGKKDV